MPKEQKVITGQKEELILKKQLTTAKPSQKTLKLSAMKALEKVKPNAMKCMNSSANKLTTKIAGLS